MKTRTKEIVRSGSREALKLLGASAIMGAIFAPHAATYAIEKTELNTAIGELPTTLSYQPHTSSVNILNTGTIFIDKTSHSIGVQAEVTGLPSMQPGSNVRDLISPERTEIYTSLIDSPDEIVLAIGRELRDETVDTFVEYLRWPVTLGGVALYSSAALLRRKLNEGGIQFSASRQVATGVVAATLAASATMAAIQYDTWTSAHKPSLSAVPITALDGTPLEGATTDNEQLVTLVTQATNYAKTLNERRDKALAAYLETATPSLESQLTLLDRPHSDEELLMVVTDFHGGSAGMQLAQQAVSQLQRQFGAEKLSTVLNLGDTVYEPELQRSAISRQAALNQNGEVALVLGNHDIDKTADYAQEDGMTVIEGRTEVNSLRIYGESDPQRSPFLAKSYYPNPDETQQTLGERAYHATLKSPVDIIALHQPAAIENILAIESIRDFVSQQPTSLTECSDSEISRDIPASMLTAGHWHINYPVHMHCNSDGTWTVVNIQGTAGAAVTAPTIDNWSDPNGRPKIDISYRVFYRNVTHGSITGFADIVIAPDGSVAPITRTNIGTSDGAPFDTKKQH